MMRQEFFYFRMHEVDNHIEDFLNKFKEILDKMTTEEFDTLVKRFYSIFLSYMACADLEWGVRGKEGGIHGQRVRFSGIRIGFKFKGRTCTLYIIDALNHQFFSLLLGIK